MTTFVKRTLSAAVFVAVMLGAIALGSWPFAILFVAITAVCLHEYYHMASLMQSQPHTAWGIAGGVLLFAWAFAQSTSLIDWPLAYIAVPMVALVFIAELFRAKEQPLHNIATTLTGWLYIAAPFAMLNFVVNTPDGYTHKYLMAMLFLVWGNDTGAYLLGMAIGRHKMFPRVSPKKSWEGFAGGIIATAIVAFAVWKIFSGTLQHWLALGAVACVFGVLGDLIESMLKRAAGVKDSGNIMPGHGGLLDRFDALLLVAPVGFVCLKLMSLI